MKIPIHIAKKLKSLTEGEKIAASRARHTMIEDLISEGIIDRYGRVQKKLMLVNKEALSIYLQNHYGIGDLQDYIDIHQKDLVTRQELTVVSSDSKSRQVRTFKGFLMNSYRPVKAVLKEQEINLDFEEGVFRFIYDFEQFRPEEGCTIVGVENAENFRFIARQKYLFSDIKPLFVSRYPQNQSKDVIRWLQSIPNPYLHFGDFDLAGIAIYLHEYKRYLGERARFFIPERIEELLPKYGNADRYNKQQRKFSMEEVTESELKELIALIDRNSKGMDQEVLIGNKEET